MADETPRRMRRFNRESGNKPSEQEVKSKSTEIALKEIDSFREEKSRYPDRKEIEEISDNVFTQLRDEMRKGQLNENAQQADSGGTPKGREPTIAEKRMLRRKGKLEEKGGKKEPQNTQKAQAKDAGEEPEEDDTAMEMPSFGDEKIPDLASEEENESQIKELSSLDELSSLEDSIEGNDIDLVDKEVETDKTKCPKCGNHTKQIVYCVNCAQGFCDHCAKSIEVQQDTVKYTCPKCGAGFKKRKVSYV